MERHERLRQARIKAGLTSAAAAARRLAVSYGTYSGHENGSRGIKEGELVRYARAFGVTPEWLRSGVEFKFRDRSAVHALGEAGMHPDGRVDLYDDKTDSALIFLRTPFDEDASFIVVRGEHLKGIAQPGMIILFPSRFMRPTDVENGDLCVCRLKDGAVYIRNIFQEPDADTFILYGGNIDRMSGVYLESVSPVIMFITQYTFRRNKKLNEDFTEGHPDLIRRRKETS